MRKFSVVVMLGYVLAAGPAAAMMFGSDEFERPAPQDIRAQAQVLRSGIGLVKAAASPVTLADLQTVNSAANRVTYVTDSDNYGVEDHWATPEEFAARGGDCEDYAIAKYAMLKARGLAADRMRVVIVRDLILDTSHAVLSVELNGVRYILDNQSPDVRPDTEITRYRPVYAINETGWWLYMPRS